MVGTIHIEIVIHCKIKRSISLVSSVSLVLLFQEGKEYLKRGRPKKAAAEKKDAAKDAVGEVEEDGE